MKTQNVSRRRFIGTGMLAAAGMALASKTSFAHSLLADNKPNSLINGIQIGVITYSFRSMPGTIQDMLKYCIDSNINACELMGEAAEAYAGAPKWEQGSTDFAAKMANWRMNAPMDKFKEIRKMFDDAGIKIYAWKPNALGAKNTDAEIDDAFIVAKVFGCTHVTVELPEDQQQTKRLGDKAAQNKIYVGYHAHTQATPGLWDVALSQSDYNAINLDIGHYVAGTSSSPIDFILKNSERIVSMHIKDRKFNNGPNMPWGQGDTPIKDVLLLMKKKKYKFPATIELEYKIPDGSDAVKEVIKCRAYAADILKG